MSEGKLTVKQAKKIIAMLRETRPAQRGPTTWAIDENEDGWMVTFAGPATGAISPRAFCEMVIKQLNGR